MMTMTVTVETLRIWLEEGQPVTILDVRPTVEYTEWSIPGSLHSDAYDALKAHDPAALSGVTLPTDRPIVTVCGAGKTSQIAAEQLMERGLQVFSLEGGMKAWSLSWNTACVSGKTNAPQIIQVRRTGKGCLSYLVGKETEAFVIDASLDPQVYIGLAARYGWQITSVLDTHIHADHLSRSRQLAQMSGARLFLPRQQRVTFPFTVIDEGQTPVTSALSLTAISTPGHTNESTCYLLDQFDQQVLFTGDTLFPTSVGRPDLEADEEQAHRRAEALYQSIQQLFTLPRETLVLSAHTSQPVPFDGVPLVTTLGDIAERIPLIHEPREKFVQATLSRIPPTPPNYQRIVRLNEIGMFPEHDAIELEAGANRCAIA